MKLYKIKELYSFRIESIFFKMKDFLELYLNQIYTTRVYSFGCKFRILYKSIKDLDYFEIIIVGSLSKYSPSKYQFYIEIIEF